MLCGAYAIYKFRGWNGCSQSAPLGLPLLEPFCSCRAKVAGKSWASTRSLE